jgi:hypothetical protein
MPVPVRKTNSDQPDDLLQAGVGEDMAMPPMMAPPPMAPTPDFTPPPPEPPPANKTTPRESDQEKSHPAPVVPKTPTSAALTGGTANVTQARGGGSFNQQNVGDLARSLSSRPMYGSMQGLTGGGLGVPGLEQTGSENAPSPLFLKLLQLFGGQ